MFTGIVEEIGTIRKIDKGVSSCSITVQADKVLHGSQVGDSIAVNGVCLTATGISGNIFTADVMPETLRRSGLGQLTGGGRRKIWRTYSVRTYRWNRNDQRAQKGGQCSVGDNRLFSEDTQIHH